LLAARGFPPLGYLDAEEVSLPGERIGLVALAVVGAILLMAPSAGATTTPYWGYNYISSTNPPAGTCTVDGYGYPAGYACSGWNYWDYSQIDRASSSGGNVVVGFRFTSTSYIGGNDTTTGGTYTIKWNDPIFGSAPTHYNRAACYYWSGNRTYVQCRDLIF
jgi:hypothetical protein